MSQPSDDERTVLPGAPTPEPIPTVYPAPASGDGTVYPEPPAATSNTCPACGRPQDSGSASTWALKSKGAHFGPYQLLAEIGKGGMGIVYRARDTRIDHLVALKVLVAGDVEAFRHEVRTLMQLDHPHLLPIREFGEHDGHHYFTMPLMSDGSLEERLRQQALPPREAAVLVQQLAAGVQYAHERGVVHRDIKPQNILLSGKTPRLSDFGLARTHESQMSRTGEPIGTPSYMPPEQARGQRELMGPRSDVYALGATLYAALTGRPPFKAATDVETMKLVCEQEPVAPRQLTPSLPQELETVCLECLHKEPEKRYATARELAEELERFLSGRPVLARPVSRLEIGWRWCRRNRMVASLTALLLFVLLAAAGAVTVAMTLGAGKAVAELARDQADIARIEAELARDQADMARTEASQSRVAEERQRKRAVNEYERAERERLRAEHLLYINQISLAHREWQLGNVPQVRQVLDSTRADFRGWEYRYLYGLAHTPEQTLLGHTSYVSSVAFSPDGKRLISGGGDQAVKVWHAQTGQETLSLRGHTGGVWSVAFSPDGTRLVSSGLDRTVKVWDAQTGQETLTLQGHTDSVTSVGYRRDGKGLVSGSYDGTVKVWDAQTGREVLTLKGHTNWVLSVAFSPNTVYHSRISQPLDTLKLADNKDQGGCDDGATETAARAA